MSIKIQSHPNLCFFVRVFALAVTISKKIVCPLEKQGDRKIEPISAVVLGARWLHEIYRSAIWLAMAEQSQQLQLKTKIRRD